MHINKTDYTPDIEIQGASRSPRLIPYEDFLKQIRHARQQTHDLFAELG